MADPLLLIVVGPTGSGKSDLALELAGELRGEIVNCDSVQLYRHLDIGTAKTPVEQRRGIPHHLIDVLDPDQHFTAGDYARHARPLLHQIAARGSTPIVAGGTGFYVRALLHGLSPSPERDPGLRDRLAARKAGSLHRLLTRFDPTAAARIHPNDTQKLIRAVELCLTTRRPLTSHFRDHTSQPLTGFRVLQLGLNPPRDELASRLDRRCERMFASGLITEVEKILSMGFPPNAKALLSIGYREAVRYLQGEISYPQAVEQTQAATRQYAKRQRTWFRREQDMFWLESFGSEKKVVETAMHHLKVGINFI